MTVSRFWLVFCRVGFVHRADETHQFECEVGRADYGDLNGMPAALVQSGRMRRINEPYPNGESYRQVVDRVQSFLNDLAREWEGKRVVIIGHSATRRALDHLLSGVRLEDLAEVPFGWREGWLYVLPTGWDTTSARG